MQRWAAFSYRRLQCLEWMQSGYKAVLNRDPDRYCAHRHAEALRGKKASRRLFPACSPISWPARPASWISRHRQNCASRAAVARGRSPCSGCLGNPGSRDLGRVAARRGGRAGLAEVAVQSGPACVPIAGTPKGHPRIGAAQGNAGAEVCHESRAPDPLWGKRAGRLSMCAGTAGLHADPRGAKAVQP